MFGRGWKGNARLAGSRLLICTVAVAALVGPAMAQVATSSGSRIVVDPETRRARVVNTLDGLNAYEPPVAVQEPIILKKPRRHKPKPPPQVAEAPPPEETPSAQPAPSEEPGSSSSPSALGAEDYVSPFGPAPEPAPAPKPPPKKVAEKPKPKPQPAPPPKAEPAPASHETIPFSLSGQDDYGAPAKPQQQAAAAPPPSQTKPASGLSNVRNIHINFPPGTAEPSADVAAALQSLAGDLTNELQAKSGRLLLQAFAGTPGDKSSEARRLSLKRALAVRQLLIDSGVPSDKIDVRAMGGITDGGKPDRVDVMLRG
jgi:outer membrane protein OmpA-like peptidoglycan-associated protein